jgi:hypothetical protein
MGVCLKNLGKNKQAEHWFRQYLDLLLTGAEGTYSIEDVTTKIRDLHSAGHHGANRGEVHKAVQSAFQGSGHKNGKGRRSPPPRFDPKKLLVD